MIKFIFFLLMLILAPVIPGLINRVKAFFAGKNGPPTLQLYFDLFRLLHKKSVYSRTTSAVIRFAPHAILVATILACAFVPFIGSDSPFSFSADIILIAYLLGFARFLLVVAALDTGSSFEGMGSSREVLYGALSEPSLFCGLLVLVLATKNTSIGAIFANTTMELWKENPAVLSLVAFAWLIILLAENSRIPVDDPNTHLELTMIHEVMILDYSGKDLAMLEYASSLKLTLFCTLLVNLFCFHGELGPVYGAFSFLSGLILVALLIGLIEGTFARLRLIHVPKILVGSGALGIIALIIMLSGK